MSEENQVIDENPEAGSGTKPAENVVPLERLNKVIDERNELRKSLEAFESKEEDAKRKKLEEEEKWQELNQTLSQELEGYKPYKEKFETLDSKIRGDALSKLPKEKQEKFMNLDTPDLLNVVEELSTKSNPKDSAGTIDPKIAQDWTKKDLPEQRKHWGSILGSYQR